MVGYGRGLISPSLMKEFSITIHYTADELKQIDQRARQCRMSRVELIHARSLGKIVPTHELEDWAEAKSATKKDRRGSRAG
jgi:hypothetical protein